MMLKMMMERMDMDVQNIIKMEPGALVYFTMRRDPIQPNLNLPAQEFASRT